MIIPTCARCDRPFPANSDFAALPHGKRIAFDPELGRVWRICTKCGEWNLLSPDAAGAVVAELLGRLPVIQSDAIVHDMVGSVEVVTVAGRVDAAVTDPSAIRARQHYSRWRLVARTSTAFDVVLWTAIWIPVVTGGLDARMIRFTAGSMLFLAAGQLVGSSILRWRRYRTVNRWQLRAAALMAATAAVIALFGDATFALLCAMTAVVGVASKFAEAWFDRLFATTPVTTESGRTIQVSPDAEALFTIGMDAPGELVAYEAGTGHSFRGAHVQVLITALTNVSATKPYSARDVELGWSILRQHRDLEGIVAALGDVRPEDAHRHLFASLPGAWKAALHFAAIEASGTDAERDAIREQIAAASEVAAIAESLDSPRLKPRLGEQKH